MSLFPPRHRTAITALACTCWGEMTQLPQTLQEGRGRKEILCPKESPPLFLSTPTKSQEIALVAPLLALWVCSVEAPSWTGILSFPIPDPNKPAAFESCSLVCSHNPVIAQRTHNLGQGHEWLRWALRLQSQPSHGARCWHRLGQGSVACLLKVIFSLAGLSVAVPSC